MSPLALLNPALQTQAVRAVLPAGEKEFAGQPRQIEEPLSCVYVPPKHVVHVPPSGPLDPALHRHAARAVLPVGEPEFAGHGVQTVSTT